MDPASGTEARRPRVTVLMAVRDGATFLREAVESILAQTLRDFEFLVVNDGSTDATRATLECCGDPRMRIIDNPRPLGLAASLNHGLDFASAEYVARMDCDDISLPTRLEKQAAFMEAHPDVAICGTWVRTIGDRAGELWKFPVDDAAIRCALLFHSPFAHPSVMIRKPALDMHSLRYDTRYSKAQDYDLWARSAEYLRFANIPEVLLHYRLHTRNLSEAATTTQYECAKAIRTQLLRDLGVQPSPNELQIHESLATYRHHSDANYLLEVEQWLRKLRAVNARTRRYDHERFTAMLNERWFAACFSAARLGLRAWAIFRTSKLMENHKVRLRSSARFLLKCLVQH